MTSKANVEIRPYSVGDFRLLAETLGDPRMMRYLGGPESDERLRARHEKFVAMSANPGKGCMYVIVADGKDVGTAGYWEREQGGEVVWETGWMVVPLHQGKGIATSSMRLLIEKVVRLGSHRLLYAFPAAENLPSNAICRKLGFSLEKDETFEYPPGSGMTMRCNDWRLDLSALSGWLSAKP